MRLFGTFITAAGLMFATALPAQASLPELSRHLSETRTMTADFTQTAANGSVARGKVTLSRPGKVRFQYEKGVPLLVVANGSNLAMIDYEVAQVSKYPIRSTPLSVLLDSNPDLAKYARIVSSTARDMTVEASDRKHPEYGVITIYFTRSAAAPGGLALQAWRVLDAQGNVTQVTLSNVLFNVPVDKNLFTYRDPRPNRIPGR